jgi:hypothetical protein
MDFAIEIAGAIFHVVKATKLTQQIHFFYLTKDLNFKVNSSILESTLSP